MGIKKIIITVFYIFFISIAIAQEEKTVKPEVDSLKVDLKKEGLVVVDTIIATKKALNPLAPSKAAFYQP